MEYQESKEEIEKLVAYFESLSLKQRREYNEENTKKDFIQPLFKALGWDVQNSQEVSAEEKASKGRVDYAFKLRGVSQFYLEAKPPQADLTKADYVQQAVTYAYGRGVTWVVLTDFEEFYVFNAQTGQRFITLGYKDYIRHFDRLWLLSRSSLESGLLNEEARISGALPPSLPIEKRLFQRLREWREKLSYQLRKYHEELNWPQIDEIILLLLSRLIFIRTCEDRELESKELLSILNQYKSSERKGDLLKELRQVFRKYDGYYDSELFQEAPLLHPLDRDGYLFVDNELLADILDGLYHIRGVMADYDFSVIDADVLGQVYEQYLGYVARVAKEEAKEQQLRLERGFPVEEVIKVEEKREKRKAGGLYYTPKWVTDYIVKQTVGRFIEERSSDEILNIKILDPACGSGSFLIRVYDNLLQYHAKTKGVSPVELNSLERTGILTRNIYGVDLDSQAVEVTKLNLLLKALAQRKTLPLLGNNIRSGNSIVSGSEEELRPYFGDNWWDKKPFNWEKEFKDIMSEGGFDVVIGNPPYVRPHKLETSDKQALWAQYQVYRAKSDIYACFIQRAIDLLKPGGYASYIVSNTFMSLESFAPLRRYILDNCCILYLGLTPKKVFEAATVETIVLGLKKESNEVARRQNKVLITEYRDGTFERVKEIPQAIYYATYLNIFDISWDEEISSLSSKIEKNTNKLSDVVAFCYGLKTGDDAVFLTYTPTSPEHKKLLRRSDFGRFSTEYKGEFVWYVPEQMRTHRTTARPGNCERFERPKILVQDIGKTLVATFDEDHFYVKDALMFHQKENGLDLKFVLALINSKLLNYWYAQKFSTLSVAKNAILMLPIRHIDLSNPGSKKMHDDLVAAVDKLLELYKRLGQKDVWGEEGRELERESIKTHDRIDTLVYELYGLDEEERKLVESR